MTRPTRWSRGSRGNGGTVTRRRGRVQRRVVEWQPAAAPPSAQGSGPRVAHAGLGRRGGCCPAVTGEVAWLGSNAGLLQRYRPGGLQRDVADLSPGAGARGPEWEGEAVA